VEFLWSNDPESYTGGSILTGRAFHAAQAKGDDPDKKGYTGPPGCGLGHETNDLTSIKNIIVEKANNGCQLDNSGERSRKKL